MINVCGNWFGFADNLGHGVLYRLDFGPHLFSIPAINVLPSVTDVGPGRLCITHEGGDYFLFVIAFDGTLSKLKFGNDVTSVPTVVSEGTIGGVLPPSMYGLGMAKHNSVWTVMGINQSNGDLYIINYPNNCSAVPATASIANPIVSYGVAGNYLISLENSSSGGIGFASKSINVNWITSS